MDEIDHIVDREEVLLDAHIAAARAGGAPHAAASLICLACGAPIPEARRQALPNCCLCVACQAEFEGEDA